MSEQRERTLHFRARSSAGKKRGTRGNDETKNEKKTINVEKHVNRAFRMSELWEDFDRVMVNVDLDDDSWISRLRKR